MIALCGCTAPPTEEDKNTSELMRLSIWERGIKVESRSEKAGFAYLWFYEWYLFDAVEKAEHVRGIYDWEWTVDDEATSAQMKSDWLKMNINATENGADLTLEITNTSDHDWPEIAAIIPCFNPGPPKQDSLRNLIFLDEEHEHTYFLAKDGLELIKGEFPREIHFNHKFDEKINAWEKEREDGKFVFDEKWPTSKRDAHAGLLVRESDDSSWVMGIAWESYISAQGHNPWNCMHLSVRVGPLKKGETNTIRGKIYLIKGNKEDCLKKFREDFE